MRVTILDYGAGNLHSLAKALRTADVDVEIAADPRRAMETDMLCLPGVGAFASAAQCIAPVRRQMREALLAGHPCLGICLGMQLLFDGSEEGPGDGLGLVAGRVERLRAPVVPHMGWNTIDDASDDLLSSSGLSTAYFAHSFVCRPTATDVVTGWTSVGADRFPAAIRSANTIGVQFHPEKSSTPGLRLVAAVVSALGHRGGRS